MAAHQLDTSQGGLGIIPDQMQTPDGAASPKVGARFSLGPLRILKSWFSRHQDHPYPGTRDLEQLQAMTGLSKQQITTWLSNARRRTKSRIPPRPTSPGVLSMSAGRPLDIPQHGRMPSELDQMNPMQRWQHSPPEHEPASTTAILNAVSSSNEMPDATTAYLETPNIQSSLWGEDSSASSAGTSLSNQSSASAYSHLSGSSRHRSDPIAGQHRPRKRRSRNSGAKRAVTRTTLSQAPRRYQCTFCTETFTTKHNWQRHEKSLHLSLERWECSPDGPYILDPLGRRTCTYCDDLLPDAAHMQTHNHDACEDRPLGERSFYRKDHLFQHLHLVHHARFNETTMAHWRRDTGSVRSHCGFCGEALSSWAERADHVAAHFKAGQTMAEWVGDWGFEQIVLERVENAIPPYLIEYERNTPWPFTAEERPQHSPVSAFELIKLELDYFSVNFFDLHLAFPPPSTLQYEACCVIFGAGMLSALASALGADDPAPPAPSWFRDLLMSAEDVTRRARLTPMKTAVRYRMTDLRIIGKSDIFEGCTLEQRLQSFVELSLRLGSRLEDRDLQHEACHVVEQVNSQSPNPSASFLQFLTGLILSSTRWLVPFRHRSGLPEPEGDPEGATTGLSGVPVDQDLFLGNDLDDMGAPALAPNGWTGFDPDAQASPTPDDPHYPVKSCNMMSGLFDTTDRFYRQFNKELARFINSTISPRNPQCRVPTDEELQHQARWIMFESDDPWNQTPADNEEWLKQFKSEHGVHV